MSEASQSVDEVTVSCRHVGDPSGPRMGFVRLCEGDLFVIFD